MKTIKLLLTDEPRYQLFFAHTVRMHCYPVWILHKVTAQYYSIMHYRL